MKSESPARPTGSNSLIGGLGWFTFCYAISFVGYLGCTRGLWFWYITLNLPKWSPPVSTVTPICTLLCGLGAYSSWLVWGSERSANRSFGLVFFTIQLALSALWPWLLYSGHFLAWSAGELAAVWVVQLITALLFGRVKPTAGWLMIPSLASVAFVSVLNFAVWKLNS